MAPLCIPSVARGHPKRISSRNASATGSDEFTVPRLLVLPAGALIAEYLDVRIHLGSYNR